MITFQLLGYDVPIFVYLPLLPFELTVGTWLLLRGIEQDSEMNSAPLLHRAAQPAR